MKIRKWPIHYWRAANYAEAFPKFPDSHFKISDRWISATWIMGNNYRNPSGYYGSYPPAYLKRIYSMFPEARSIIHLFSGSLKADEVKHPNTKNVIRVDSRPEVKPSHVWEAEKLSEHAGKNYDLILADPPYSVEDAEHYGPPLCNKKKVLAECHKILRPGGTLAWMDQSIPMFRKSDWHWYGVISIYRSTNHRIRGVMLFQKI